MRIKTNCDNCGCEVYQTISQYAKGKHHYCSQKCQKEYQHKITYEVRECIICGQSFETSKKSTKRLCSTSCQKEWQKTRVGVLNPKYTRIEHKCDYCGKSYIMKKYKEKQTNNFCSNKCRQMWYSEIWSQTPEWKNESQNRMLKELNTGVINTMTKPQKIVNEILNRNFIAFVNEKRYAFYSVDNYLLNHNLIIEVMGDYWHTNPVRYSDQYSELQRKIINKDKRKHTYFVNNHNIEILYLWENDLYYHKDVCEMLIKEYIDNQGILKDYHSFNYHVNTDRLSLNPTILKPHFL